jgi:farnesyl-diphosphate farnesyltransferase
MNADPPGITADKSCLPPYSREQEKGLLTEVLRDVSRSFYLTVRVLPTEIRPQIGLAYLLARAADTIADTRVIPRERRLAKLLLLRRQLEQTASPGDITEIQRGLVHLQTLPAEKILLERLDSCFAIYSAFAPDDRRLIAEVVITLTRGMEFDLVRFPGESEDQLGALDTPEELCEYTYYVAGCVGPFWTKMCAAHLPELKDWNVAEMCELGIRFGKGLQLCNVLRDIPKDLRIGRCYLPSAELAAIGLKPSDLLGSGSVASVPEPQGASSTFAKLQPLYSRYLDRALSHLEAGWRYTMSVPATLPRLRLACAWPILIGLKTIAKLRNNYGVLTDRRIKITRGEVYGIMARTWFCKRSDIRLNHYFEQLVQEAK